MCQVHTGAYVSLLAPGKPTKPLATQERLPRIYCTYVVPITTHTHVRLKSIGKKYGIMNGVSGLPRRALNGGTRAALKLLVRRAHTIKNKKFLNFRANPCTAFFLTAAAAAAVFASRVPTSFLHSCLICLASLALTSTC